MSHLYTKDESQEAVLVWELNLDPEDPSSNPDSALKFPGASYKLSVSLPSQGRCEDKRKEGTLSSELFGGRRHEKCGKQTEQTNKYAKTSWHHFGLASHFGIVNSNLALMFFSIQYSRVYSSALIFALP